MRDGCVTDAPLKFSILILRLPFNYNILVLTPVCVFNHVSFRKANPEAPLLSWRRAFVQ